MVSGLQMLVLVQVVSETVVLVETVLMVVATEKIIVVLVVTATFSQPHSDHRIGSSGNRDNTSGC